MFEGHKMCRIGESWVFDLTEFIGYKVVIQNGVVVDYKKAFVVKMSEDEDNFEFEKMEPVNFGVMRKTKRVIQEYFREALICV